LGDGLAAETCERFRAQVHLDTREDSLLRQVLRKGRAVPGLLADGLVVQDDAADRLGGAGRREQHFAIAAAMLLGRLQLDAIEAFLDGAAAFVRGQDTLPCGNHCAGNTHQLTRVHRRILRHRRRAPDKRAKRAPRTFLMTTPGNRGAKDSKSARRRAALLERATPRRCTGLAPPAISTKLVLVQEGTLMLRMSRLTDYATVLLAALAGEPGRVQTAALLAEQTRIGGPTVCKLLKQLQRAALVTSTRGPRGGYQLARPATQISAAAILDPLEGPLALTDCSAGHGNCEIEDTCRVGRVWQRLNLAIRRSLYEVS